MINKLQNLFEIALQQNVNKTVHEMKVAIGAVLYNSTVRREKITIFIVYKALTHGANTGWIK